jgi:epoxide hydrolase-like predicted phosphatase
VGTLPEAEFSKRFGDLLGVDGDGLIERLMAETHADIAMVAAIRRARHHGIVTGLISNSWGADRYDADTLRDLFDGVVISGKVGIRKPAMEIYEMGAAAVRLPASECVYVDDLPGNLKPARALGMTTVHHRDAVTTVTELSGIFGIDLSVDLD